MEYRIPSPMSAIEACRKMYPESSRRTLQNWIKAGRFTVGEKALKKENDPLEEGQTLVSKETFAAPKIPGVKILYEDRYLVAIDKPVGLLSVPLDDGSETERHALGLLKKHLGTDGIFAVHRIDREVSGVLLFARGKESEERLKKLFEKHDLRRQYFAIVEGRLKEQNGTWKCHLTELPSYDVIESEEGKESITHFEVIRRSAKYTYLRLVLETGRKHQIRVHCQRAGHPILGDERYGSLENPIRRLCLHAALLEFVHPFTRKKLSITTPMPAPFKSLVPDLKTI
jgi:tRNA pseudouridine32 synthase/23S rRNA pseudouridine746 synthase/23S rRNA pseudouridine1911/1915/1917 synthase